jgi:hypothetical protein
MLARWEGGVSEPLVFVVGISQARALAVVRKWNHAGFYAGPETKASRKNNF